MATLCQKGPYIHHCQSVQILQLPDDAVVIDELEKKAWNCRTYFVLQRGPIYKGWLNCRQNAHVRWITKHNPHHSAASNLQHHLSANASCGLTEKKLSH